MRDKTLVDKDQTVASYLIYEGGLISYLDLRRFCEFSVVNKTNYNKIYNNFKIIIR
jgi:hypothetical protein